MGTRNPYADDIRTVDVRCKVCGHEWSTRTAYPQCANPKTTEIDCGQSTDWEYVHAEKVPDELEGTAVDPRTTVETEESNEESTQENDSEESEESDESENESAEEEPDEESQDTETGEMVSPQEYAQFHGDVDAKESDTEDETAPTDAGKVGSSDAGLGIPFPTDLLIPLVIVAVLLVAFLYLRRTDTVTPETTGAEIQEPEPEPEPEPEKASVDDHQKVRPRRGDEIQLFEDN